MQVKSYEAERACGLTFHFSVRHDYACETRAVREGIQSPCGSEQSKYRQRCHGVQVSDGLSDGLGGQRFVFTLKHTPERAEVDLLDVGNGTQIIANGEGAFAAAKVGFVLADQLNHHPRQWA